MYEPGTHSDTSRGPSEALPAKKNNVNYSDWETISTPNCTEQYFAKIYESKSKIKQLTCLSILIIRPLSHCENGNVEFSIRAKLFIPLFCLGFSVLKKSFFFTKIKKNEITFLNAIPKSLLISISLNIPSNRWVNPAPHSVKVCHITIVPTQETLVICFKD